jgi:penicillin-insensitive murein endopeptidase
MNLRVSLLLVAVLALVAGAFAISWDDSHAPRTVGQSAPAHQALAQALPPSPEHKQIVQAEPPAPELAPAVTAPAEPKTPDAAAAPATEPKPAIAAEQPQAGNPDVANAPSETPTQDATPAEQKPVVAEPAEQKPAPVVAAPPAQTEKPAAAKPVDKELTPVVTAPTPTTDKPAMAKPAEQKPAPVVTAPPVQTETPAAATAPAQAPEPTVAAPTPPEKPVIVMTPLPEKRPDTSATALEKNRPAKYLFGAKKMPSDGRARAIGYYPNGCLAGGVELPVDGPNWQAMRLSRNRNWGHPELVRFLERFAPRAAKATGWPGVLIGDLSQPRGGPTPFGHRSHQTGLDVDIWFMPMPEKRLSRQQRENISATHLVASNGKELNPKTWTPETADFIRVAAEQPAVERVLVNAAIKKELCRLQGKKRWPWMAKVRPWYGHDDHIHVRLKCPVDSPHCRSQPAVPGGDGCSNQELAFWFADRVLHPKPPKYSKPAKQMMLADLPAACKTVLTAPAKKSHLAADGR